MESEIISRFTESGRLKEEFLKENLRTLRAVITVLAQRLEAGNKILLFGNGGSAADAQHIAAEFVNRFTMERPPLPAISLTTDVSVLTSISNDYSFSEVFAKQLKALSVEGDIVIAISTSGNSPNILKAMEVAKKKRLTTVAFTGLKGERFASKATYAFVVPSDNTPRIQETHITLGHVICQMVEEILFEAPRKK